MSLGSHLQELRRKHEFLSDCVEKTQRSLGSNDAEIAELKKKKMKVKEEIQRLSRTDLN